MPNYLINGNRGIPRNITISSSPSGLAIICGRRTLYQLRMDDPIGEALGILGRQPAAALAADQRFRKLAKMALAVDPMPEPRNDLCSHCQKNPAGNGACPYASSVDSVEKECDCCPECRSDCADNI